MAVAALGAARGQQGTQGEETSAMREALAEELGGIDSVERGERPDPAPAAGQALVRVHGAGAGPWDVGFLSGGFPGLTLPFVPGQEVAGVVEAVGYPRQDRAADRAEAMIFLLR
jgi:NADPH2:quinone reductase